MINVLRVVISAIIGYWIYIELALEGFIVFVFFFGIFIAVSILFEIIKKMIERKNFQNRKSGR